MGLGLGEWVAETKVAGKQMSVHTESVDLLTACGGPQSVAQNKERRAFSVFAYQHNIQRNTYQRIWGAWIVSSDREELERRTGSTSSLKGCASTLQNSTQKAMKPKKTPKAPRISISQGW